MVVEGLFAEKAVLTGVWQLGQGFKLLLVAWDGGDGDGGNIGRDLIGGLIPVFGRSTGSDHKGIAAYGPRIGRGSSYP